MTTAYQRTIRMLARLPSSVESGLQTQGVGGVGARGRVWTPASYRDGAVYEVVKALNEARAIGDPDDLNRLAEAVVDALQTRTSDREGWLFIRDENWRVIETDNTDGVREHMWMMVLCESNEGEDPDA